jgi:peptide-methionine (R)-S-oxide reductase
MRRLRLSGEELAKLFAAGRLAIGAAVLARPEALTRGLRVDSSTARRTAWLARMFGVRDMVLGGGTLFALSRRAAPGPWLVASAMSDATDAAALTAAIRQRQVSAPPAALGAGMAVVSVAVQARAGWEVRAASPE